ncbi:MAG: enoyl-CoA hydratase/isomerase family protein [Candidatus Carbobacillus altaicus]|nr:enoyl-CoA hydratase/isomerase family protein [Candidatus Carbobacillus altaicus]
MTHDTIVRTDIQGTVGFITLNRPDKLNALNIEMIDAIFSVLRAWEADQEVRVVVMRGAGVRGFCAGGDIRELYAARETRDHLPARRFFEREYVLDHYVATYPKPILAFLDGIVMGGGVGLTAGARYRIVTERTRWAMPESGIGFFPDVGMRFFLSRLPHHAGRYLALTGESIGSTILLALGLAECEVRADEQDLLQERLIATLSEASGEGLESPSQEALEILLRKLCHRFQGDVQSQEDALLQEDAAQGKEEAFNREVQAFFQKTEQYFSGDSLKVVIQKLEAGRADGDAWADKTLGTLSGRSPTALFVIWEGLRRAQTMRYEETLIEDVRLSRHFLEHGDFYEGIRAQVIDKDRRPQWRPARMDEVNAEDVERFFEPFADETKLAFLR